MHSCEAHHYTQDDVIRALRAVGLQRGDAVFCHSNVGFFGVLQDAREPIEYARHILQAFMDVIGEEGTLIVPTFSYSYCHREIFIPEDTPGVGGMFAEAIRRHPRARRSRDANFSIAAIGKLSVQFTEVAPAHSFGPGCFWERLLEANGRFVNLNFDAGSTFFHYVEKQLNVPYRYDKAFYGTSMINGQETRGVFFHFVYDQSKPHHGPNFVKFDRKARAAGIATTAQVGRGQIVSLTARDTFDLIQSELSRDPAFLIQGMCVTT